MSRMRCGELERRGGHHAAPGERHRTDDGAPRIRAAERVDLGPRLGELGERETHPPREPLRLARRPHAERGRFEQRDPEPPFELPRGPVQ
jgi:hypothetical protein